MIKYKKEDYNYLVVKRREKIVAIFDIISYPCGDSGGRAKLKFGSEHLWRKDFEYTFEDKDKISIREKDLSMHRIKELTKEMLCLLI